ncbi:protein Jumonji-like [Diaphorina citri]|uniref:Protein Jumonji-like n=1 Tax=Diaphorina citri TaxID=121845 RepID=A0A3Q0JK70_DIACI|nr:protein Jumonji-like [Diaphorina citri]
MVGSAHLLPNEKEFQEPSSRYIEKIRPSAGTPECKLNDDMRFTAYNQYVHKMLHRWGPNVKEMVAIRKYLATQSVSMQQLPLIGGIEVDLPRLYSTVQQCGGLSEVIEKKRWPRVADLMKIPRLAQDRLTKLDDIYCKYLLPYDTLSHDERLV